MCMLTFLPAGVLPNAERLRNGTISNRDGHGWAIVVLNSDGTGSHILTGRSMNADAAIESFARTRAKHPEGPALFHSRFTTGGLVDETNCHPYVVAGDPRTVLAHNGILIGMEQPEKDKRSDTRYFCDEYGPLLYPGIVGGFNLNSKRGRRRLRQWLGNPNKFVILTVDPTFKHNAFIINESQGIWEDDGCWYSNRGYMERTWGTGTGYYGTWDDDWNPAKPSKKSAVGAYYDRLASAYYDGERNRYFIDKGARPIVDDSAPVDLSCYVCGAKNGMDGALNYCRICGTCGDCGGDALEEYGQSACDCFWPTGTHPGRRNRLEEAFGVRDSIDAEIDRVIAEAMVGGAFTADGNGPDDSDTVAESDTGWPTVMGPPARKALSAGPDGGTDNG